MPTKVCIITSVHQPFDTRIFHKEAKSLRKAGYDITLIAQYDKEETIDGIKIVPIPKPKNRAERVGKTIWMAYRKALKINADIYHSHDPELIPIGILLRIHGKKVIYDMHENLPKQIKNKPWIKPWCRSIISTLISCLERIMLAKIPVIFAETSYHKDYSWLKKYSTILNMPLLDQQLLNVNTDTSINHNFSIGYIGGVSFERGSLTTLEALKLLKKNGYEPRYECVGPVNKEHKEQLLRLCKKYDLNKAAFYGYLPAYEGWQIIGKCSVGLAVLHPIPNYLESYPTKIFEYMAMGLPVIASNFPLYREVIEGTGCGICVDPLDSTEIAQAIKSIAEHPAGADEMGKKGRQAVLKKYNWTVEERKLLRFYERLI
jgi:glycosyltransferase involved in cell wall biosynthesis